GFAVIAIFAGQRISRARPGHAVRRAVLEGYRHGRRAEWLVAADWENLMAEPVDAIRTRFCVTPPLLYPQVLAAIRAEQAAGGPQVFPRAEGPSALPPAGGPKLAELWGRELRRGSTAALDRPPAASRGSAIASHAGA